MLPIWRRARVRIAAKEFQRYVRVEIFLTKTWAKCENINFSFHSIDHRLIGWLIDWLLTSRYSLFSLQEFIVAAYGALASNVKAVLLRIAQPKWRREYREFSSFNFLSPLKKVISKNFHLEFRDEESRRTRRKEAPKTDDSLTVTPTFTSSPDNDATLICEVDVSFC